MTGSQVSGTVAGLARGGGAGGACVSVRWFPALVQGGVTWELLGLELTLTPCQADEPDWRWEKSGGKEWGQDGCIWGLG